MREDFGGEANAGETVILICGGGTVLVAIIFDHKKKRETLFLGGGEADQAGSRSKEEKTKFGGNIRNRNSPACS